MTTAKNPTISKAARDRVTERLASFDSEQADKQRRYPRAVSLGDGSDKRLAKGISQCVARREGYVAALHDLLPEQTVNAILDGADDEDDASEDA